MDTDPDSLASSLYVSTDYQPKAHLEHAPVRSVASLTPRISDAELVTMAVLQALRGYTSEADWLRHAPGASGVTCFRTSPANPLTTSGCRLWSTRRPG